MWPDSLEQLGAFVLRIADAREPLRAAAKDGRRDRDALDIVDRRRAAIQTSARRERGLEARLALLAFEALKHRHLFAADVRAGTAVDEDVEVVAAACRVLAEQAGVVAFLDGAPQDLGLADELAADVDVGRPRAHGEAGNQRAFQQLMRIVADDLAVLAGAGLGLVRVDDQEIGLTGLRLLGHEAPLHAGREAGAAAPAQSGGLDRVDDRVLADGHQRLGIVPVPALLRSLQPRLLEAVDDW